MACVYTKQFSGFNPSDYESMGTKESAWLEEDDLIDYDGSIYRITKILPKKAPNSPYSYEAINLKNGKTKTITWELPDFQVELVGKKMNSKQFGRRPTYYWKIYYTDELGNKGEDYFSTESALFEKNNGALWKHYNRGLTPYKLEKITKEEYIRNTKQFSDKPITEENSSTVVGQIIKNHGKTLFQIVAMTDDMELAGKTKNALLKMGYDSKEDVKQFSESDEILVPLSKSMDWSVRKTDKGFTAYTVDKRGNPCSDDFDYKDLKTLFTMYRNKLGYGNGTSKLKTKDIKPWSFEDFKKAFGTDLIVKQHSFAIFDKNEKVLDIDGNFVDFKTCSPDEIEYFEDRNEAIKRAMEVNGSVKQFARTFGAPQPISVHGQTFYILGYNNKEYAIQDETGQNLLGDLKTQGVDWNTIVYWLRKQGANTSKAEALKLCVDERVTHKGVITL